MLMLYLSCRCLRPAVAATAAALRLWSQLHSALQLLQLHQGPRPQALPGAGTARCLPPPAASPLLAPTAAAPQASFGLWALRPWLYQYQPQLQQTRHSDSAWLHTALTAAADGRRTTHQSMFAHGALATMALGSRRWVHLLQLLAPPPCYLADLAI
jgi:hypothetical protein